MCGIAGAIVRNSKENTEELVSDMLNVISYRGPNGLGVKKYGEVVLGMVRLSIIDDKDHVIPYEDPNSGCAIVYNGEIYNHSSIRSSLLSKHKFNTSSDAETALHNYIERGEKSFSDYNGMYAFAIYDPRIKTTYLVRDKAGEKPLYYCRLKESVYFASEIKCLLKVIKPEFNISASSYKAYEFTVGKETLFKGVYSLEPGEFIKIKNNSVSIHEYWKVWNNLIDIKDDEKRVVSELAELVEDAILLRTKNCVHKYGCFISGGIDSSLIACIAKPDFIYTVHYDYEDFDALDYAQLVANKIKRNLVIIKPSKSDFLRTKESIIFHLDSPCTWTSFSLWMLLEEARKKLKVVLSGEGADEIFSGYHRYHLLYHDEAMKNYRYLIERYYGSPVERYVKLINRFDNQHDNEVNKYLFESVNLFFDRVKGDIVHSMGLNDFYTTMQVLLQMSDRLCMAFSIENRSPYLDYRLIQYGFSMPSKYKIKDGITKWALKEVAKKFIPKEIVSRTDKRGFSAPLNRWFGWENYGKYDRSSYRKLSLDDWRLVFGVNGGSHG